VSANHILQNFREVCKGPSWGSALRSKRKIFTRIFQFSGVIGTTYPGNTVQDK
jgi:hypothetical protein